MADFVRLYAALSAGLSALVLSHEAWMPYVLSLMLFRLSVHFLSLTSGQSAFSDDDHV